MTKQVFIINGSGGVGLYDACLNKASEVTLMNSYRFDNGLNCRRHLREEKLLA